MRLVAISRVKNEIDIAEAFIRHTAAFVDFHLVVDNGSTDGTLGVLRSLAGEGLAVEISEDCRFGPGDGDLLNGLMYEARTRLDADWVLPLDADEFLGAGSRARLEADLGRGEVPVLVKWQTHVPDPADDAIELNPAVRLRHRLQSEARRWEKVFVPGGVIEGGALTAGHHDIVLREKLPPDRIHLDGWPLCHLPVRSASQFAVKVLMGNLAYVARGTDRNGHGFHYEAPFEVLMADWPRFAADHYDAARRFAVPPEVEFTPEVVPDQVPYRGGSLHFTPPPRDGEPWRTVVEYAAQLAAAVGINNSQHG